MVCNTVVLRETSDLVKGDLSVSVIIRRCRADRGILKINVRLCKFCMDAVSIDQRSGKHTVGGGLFRFCTFCRCFLIFASAVSDIAVITSNHLIGKFVICRCHQKTETAAV